MKRLFLLLTTLFILAGCVSSAPQSTNPQPTPQPSETALPPATKPLTPSEPTVVFDGDLLRLPEGIAGKIPAEVQPFGAPTLLLDGVEQETARIYFSECPNGAPDSGCLHNHRGITVRGTAVVAGKSASYFEADYQLPSTANDPRTWLELHTILPLPSGRRIDIVAQVLKGSGKEEAVRQQYEALLDSLSGQ